MTEQELTEQELFNRAVIRTLQQGCKSGNDQVCEYRSANGTRCPVGHLLTDEEIDSVGEGAVRDVYEEGNLPKRLVPHLGLLEKLQFAHDDAYEPFTKSFALAAAGVARRFFLDFPTELQEALQ